MSAGRILIDRHHHALNESYHLTLADRLGYEVFAPYGMGWWDADIWQFEKQFHGDAVAKQYLLGIWGDVPEGQNIIQVDDVRHPGRVLMGVTLKAAREMEWDLVISSLPHNDEGYWGFAQQAGARFGVQVGNHVQSSRWDLADFILASSTLQGYGPSHIGQRFSFMGKPTVMYHQEFSLDIFRHEWPPANRREVASWVNAFPESPDYPLFLQLAREYASEFDFKVYGARGWGKDDEFMAEDVSLVTDVADRMREARVGLHVKRLSDGFGHTIHNWFAIGRPVLGFMNYYSDKIASALFVEGVTSFALETRTNAEIADIIRRLIADDDLHRTISENAAARFREVVDFDAEAVLIKRLLEDVLS